ncbi:hypothetical protein Asp14428_32790 [Actinoplanes sp. NBRC 14428]|nr:hypothetical protein Asp14428_32790 [Actinoplanes sp. NBRC 14428]
MQAMDEARFWGIIDMAEGGSSDAGIRRIEAALDGHTPDEIVSFAEHLAQRLHRLDTPAHAHAAGALPDDSFLYLRCAVVLAGRAPFSQVVHHPEALAAFRGRDAEPLLYAAERAYEARTGHTWTHEPAVDIESGSNPAWQEEEIRSTDAGEWLSVTMPSGDSGNGMIRSYVMNVDQLTDALNGSAEWISWWRRTGKQSLDLRLTFDADRPEAFSMSATSTRVRMELSRHRRGPEQVNRRRPGSRPTPICPNPSKRLPTDCVFPTRRLFPESRCNRKSPASPYST